MGYLLQRSLGRDVTARLVSALVISLLDYCNSVLTHLPASMLAPLQRVLNAAVRLVHDLGPREHVTPVMYELPIAERIKFKLCLLVYHAVNGRAPTYLTEMVSPVANIPERVNPWTVSLFVLFFYLIFCNFSGIYYYIIYYLDPSAEQDIEV